MSRCGDWHKGVRVLPLDRCRRLAPFGSATGLWCTGTSFTDARDSLGQHMFIRFFHAPDPFVDLRNLILHHANGSFKI
ncbi:unnamed protein product [Brassica rapa subsp. trilocularis]